MSFHFPSYSLVEEVAERARSYPPIKHSNEVFLGSLSPFQDACFIDFIQETLLVFNYEWNFMRGWKRIYYWDIKFFSWNLHGTFLHCNLGIPRLEIILLLFGTVDWIPMIRMIQTLWFFADHKEIQNLRVYYIFKCLCVE